MRRVSEHGDVVGADGRIYSDQGEALVTRLGDQEAIERISVMPWQRLHASGMPGEHGQLGESRSLDEAR